MKIICIGRNYMAHAKELGNGIPAEPLFFLKPDTCLLKDNQPFFLPDLKGSSIHYETELVVKINKNGKHIEPKFAPNYFDEISVGIDFTARDLQETCKTNGWPWEIAKAFDGSAPVGQFISKQSLPPVEALRFSLLLNGLEVQTGCACDMLFPVNSIISHVSKYITLRQGDLIYTGTPMGVGPVKIGDTLEAFLEGQSLLKFQVK